MEEIIRLPKRNQQQKSNNRRRRRNSTGSNGDILPRLSTADSTNSVQQQQQQALLNPSVPLPPVTGTLNAEHADETVSVEEEIVDDKDLQKNAKPVLPPLQSQSGKQ